ncbi:MAG: right-handed parallel beta-helix repeat-containing protein [Phycisphaeraceae bacterium]|nr:right-handed parallel beta-helix repeat-containing protein [Phycisphaeraceae bacterium]
MGTMLMASPPVSSQLMISVKAGVDHVQVDDSSIFEVGDDVMVATPSQGGWGATRVGITRIDSPILWFDGPMIQDYDANAPAMVCHWFPLINVQGQSQVQVSDLHLMGNCSAIGDTPFGPDDACSGIQLIGAEQCMIERVFVEDWAHDGIGLYASSNCYVQQCHIRNSLGHGIRVGDESGSNWISQNQCQLNAGVGIYLSGQSLPCIVSQNVLHCNRKGDIAARSNGHHVKANLGSHVGISPITMPSPLVPVRDPLVDTVNPKPAAPTYTNHIGDPASNAAARTNEQSVSRRLRGLDAFD